MQKKLHQLFFISIGLIFLYSSYISAGGYVELPRSFGSLEIGMSERAFSRLTNITPERCAICIDNETFASLSAEQLDAIDIDANGADVFFYDKKLYLISFGAFNKDLFGVKEEFEHQFGGPGKKLVPVNDVAKIKWEDQNSVATINYHATRKNVFSINHYDWDTKQERDWRESQARENNKKKSKTVAITN